MPDPRRDEHPPAAPIFRARGWLLVEWSALLLAGTLLIGGLVFAGATTRLDNAIYDFALKFRHRPAPPDIVIVGIDFPSMTKLGPWPWPRETLAAILDTVARGHPRAVVFQFLVATKGSPAGDAALHAAVAAAPVFLPEALDDPGRGIGAHLIKPIAAIASVAAGVGLSNPTPDLDGIVRRAVLYGSYNGRELPDVAVLAAGQSRGGAARTLSPAHENTVAKRGEVLIPFAGPPGHFDRVSAADVLHGLVQPGRFRDRYVLVGPTAPGLLDNYPTPVSGADGMSSVEIEANTLDAVLHHHLVRALPPTATVVLSLILLWVTFFELLWLKPTQFALQPIGSLAVLLGSAGALILTGVWFPPMSIVIVRTIVQIVWSSRRLQAASDYFARELAELQIRSGGAILPVPGERGLPMGDSVTRQMILIDETKRRIRELRRFVTDVLANFSDPVMVVTSRGRVLMYNQAAVDLAQKLGRPTDPGAYVQPILQDLADAAGNRCSLWPPNTGPGVVAPRGVAPGGRILEARYAATGQEDAGEVKGWTVHLADVTAQVSAMRQREEALQLFTHDMRAPQSAILAALEHEDFQSVPQELRDRISRNAMRTVALAEGFVRLAQAESPEYYTFAPIDLFHLLGDAADALWSIARAASVEIVVEDPEREFVVDADRGLMARALINLLDNAVKFSPPAARVTCILAETRLRDRPAVCCSITDQSDGMTAEQQRGLFDPFARPPLLGDNDDAMPDPGSGVRLGMGLAMVQTVVHRHDGVIDWRSEKGRGTVFTVTLPLCPSEESEDCERPSSRGEDQKLLQAPPLAIET
ncbi:MAG: signal transduction histidine kinase [Caulobacteraceae bacterium]|jgi:CHASE2 domain-containing sensor protein|nr:signal transduction histidine kinase [Caulobacteraceae bacterium]